MPGITRVFSGCSAAANQSKPLAFPNLAYSALFVRHAVDYSKLWYYEYIFLESGTLTINSPIVCDLFLVGSGGLGATTAATNTTNPNPCPGGGSGFPASLSNVTLGPGDHLISLGVALPSSITSPNSTIPGGGVTAAKGGDASTTSTTSTLGVGFEGAYFLYGDPLLPAGAGGGVTAGSGSGSAPTPGRGGSGCEFHFLRFVRPEPGLDRQTTSSNYNWRPTQDTNFGFGAGAFGKSPRYVKSPEGYIFMAVDPQPAQGVVALRIKI